MVVPITDVVKITLSVADISVEPIIGTPLVILCTVYVKLEVLLLQDIRKTTIHPMKTFTKTVRTSKVYVLL